MYIKSIKFSYFYIRRFVCCWTILPPASENRAADLEIENLGNFVLKILGILQLCRKTISYVRDLSVYIGSLGGTLKHYRDNAGLECDAVVHLEDGRWGGIEIKLGGDALIEDGAKSLKRLRNKIVEKSNEKAPSFLLVLTAVGAAYRRADGVYVAPINLLKP